MSGDEGKARIVEANRSQIEWGRIDLEADLPADHIARVVWDFTGTLDLSAFYAKIKARGDHPGRPAADPRVLLALWLLATIDGVGSARALAQLCEQDLAYRWLAGGVPVNYHGLADFRTAHTEALDDLLTRSLATFLAEGLADPTALIVDGTKVKASAGKSSYKRAARLEEAETAAKAQVARLKAELEADPAATAKRQHAAKQRAAAERLAKIEKAKRTLAEIDRERSKRAEHDKKEVEKMKAPRASLTDPEARRMRFADGAVKPGYNVQIAATVDHGFITAIKTTSRRNDMGLAAVMVAESERRTGQAASRLLADTGYADEADITALTDRTIGGQAAPVEVYIPVKPDDPDVKPETLRRREQQRERECTAMKAWRARMASEAAEAIMKQRSRIERINAHLKTHGFATVLVRGAAKVQCVALLHGLAHNLLTALRLRAARAAAAAATA